MRIPHFENGDEGEYGDAYNRYEQLHNLYEDRASRLPRVRNYSIPWIDDKAVTLSNAGLATGARVSTNLLDSLAYYAEKVGIPVKTALGLAVKESTLGNPTDDTSIYLLLSKDDELYFRHANAMREAAGESAQHINTGKSVNPADLVNFWIDGNPYIATLEYVDRYPEYERKVLALTDGLAYADKLAKEYIKRFPNGDKSVLEEALLFYKDNPDKYNPGQRNYRQLVNKRADEVWNSPEILSWNRERSKNKKIAKEVGSKVAEAMKLAIPHFGEGEDGRITAMRYFIDRGMTPYAAAGLVGNLYRESNLVPDSVNSSSGAYGIAQWLGDRKKNLFARYGNKPTLEQQLDYVWHELNNTHKRGLTMLNGSQSVEDAAKNGFGYYEFSVGPEGAVREMNRYGQNGQASMNEGIRNANNIWNLYAPIMRRELNQREAKFGKVPVENASQRMSVTVKPVAPRLTPPVVQLPVIKPKTENNNTALRKTLFSNMMLAAGLTDLFNL